MASGTRSAWNSFVAFAQAARGDAPQHLRPVRQRLRRQGGAADRVELRGAAGVDPQAARDREARLRRAAARLRPRRLRPGRRAQPVQDGRGYVPGVAVDQLRSRDVCARSRPTSLAEQQLHATCSSTRACRCRRPPSPSPGRRPNWIMPRRSAAPRVTSITRPPTKGPRSLIRTTTGLAVVEILDPHLRPEGKAPVRGGEAAGIHPLAARGPRSRAVPGRLAALTGGFRLA